jgi:hypothetical protein
MLRRGVPAILMLVLLGGCPPPSVAPTRPLPSYVGRSTELFDDAIEPLAVGLETDINARAKSDPLLRERVQIGDATLRVRIDTITVKQEEDGSSFQVGFRVLDQLAGQHPPGESFAVRVDKQSPSAGILKSYEGQLVGKNFTAFIRLFVRPDGDQEMHFHLAPDSKEVTAAVRDATALADFH